MGLEGIFPCNPLFSGRKRERDWGYGEVREVEVRPYLQTTNDPISRRLRPFMFTRPLTTRLLDPRGKGNRSVVTGSLTTERTHGPNDDRPRIRGKTTKTNDTINLSEFQQRFDETDEERRVSDLPVSGSYLPFFLFPNDGTLRMYTKD